MENILISACLMGAECKYSGGSNVLPEEALAALRERFHLIPVCPEFAGGLPTPREPSERKGDRVVSRVGTDVSSEFKMGAQVALRLCEKFGCKKALLKANSPSCGSGAIYDGTFSNVIVPGDGVTAQLLKEKGINTYSELETEKLLV